MVLISKMSSCNQLIRNILEFKEFFFRFESSAPMIHEILSLNASLQLFVKIESVKKFFVFLNWKKSNQNAFNVESPLSVFEV